MPEAAARPWLFVGTVPEPDFPLSLASFRFTETDLALDGKICPLYRGTPAMLGAASAAYGAVHSGSPADSPGNTPDGVPANASAGIPANASTGTLMALVAGDTGRGEGSRAVYARLLECLPALAPRGVTFHYLLPDVDWHNRVLMAAQALPERPLLVADAGFMYAAKMSGYAAEYDLFTPDIGELAFLADADAPHPFYTRNFLLADESAAEALIASAVASENAAKHMLVKGKIDRYVKKDMVLDTVDGPDAPMLEPVGGTGDTLTGIVSALLASGLNMNDACPAALRANRIMGELAHPTPASGIGDLLPFIPEALRLAGVARG